MDIPRALSDVFFYIHILINMFSLLLKMKVINVYNYILRKPIFKAQNYKYWSQYWTPIHLTPEPASFLFFHLGPIVYVRKKSEKFFFKWKCFHLFVCISHCFDKYLWIYSLLGWLIETWLQRWLILNSAELLSLSYYGKLLKGLGKLEFWWEFTCLATSELCPLRDSRDYSLH